MILFYFILFKFYFIFKLYITVLVLPNIKMNPPQVYMCSPFFKCSSSKQMLETNSVRTVFVKINVLVKCS